MSAGKLSRANSMAPDDTTVASSSVAAAPADGDNVRVGVRIRPSIQTEKDTEVAFLVEDEQVKQMGRNGGAVKFWPFDYVFGSESSTKDVYMAMAKGIVEASLLGYNGVVFAYGQTASGKTFTLFGNEQYPGLVPMTVQDLGRLITTSQKAEYVVKLSYIELYNENINDLLRPESTDLKIQENPVTGPYIANLSEVVITDWNQVTSVLRQGEENRHFASTNMNERSSRSHVLVRFVIESRTLQATPATPLRSSWGKDKPTHSSSLHLVDLAGSERQSRTGAEGARLREGGNINRSLLVLGTVISSLSKGKRSHIPYRDSKLTRLLSSALGGNAKTAMIACISPADSNIDESVSTLRFASRAKNVVNHARQNELDKAGAVLEKYQSEIERLRSELSRVRDQEALEDLQSANATVEKIRQVYHLTDMLSKAMRRVGNYEEAKKVKQELKAVVFGKLDAEVMLEENTNLIQQLPANLRDRLTHQLNARSMAADDATHATSNADTLEDEDGLSDGGSWGSAYSDEELMQARESLETSRLEWEDLRCRYVRLDQAYVKQQRDHAIALEATNRERNRLNDQLASSQDKIQSLNMEIETLNRKLNNQGQQFEETQRSSQSLQSTLQTQLDEERNSRIELQNENDQLRQEVVDKAMDCERLEHELENARSDLVQTVKRHKVAEEDAVRIRCALQSQIESLRLGMSNLMEQDGEKTAYLNAELREMQEENVRLLASVNEYKNKSDQQAEFIAKLQSHSKTLLAEAQQSKVESQKFRQVVEATKQKLTTTNMELTRQHTRTKLLGADLDDALRKLNAVTESAQQDFQERNERIRTLEETLAKLRTDHITTVEDLQQRLQLSEEQGADAAARWEHERGWLKSSVSELEKRLDKALEAEKEYRAQVVRMESNNKELLASLTRERDDLRAKLDESENLLNELADFTQSAFQQLMQPKDPVTPRVSLQLSKDEGSLEGTSLEVITTMTKSPHTPAHRRMSSTRSSFSITSATPGQRNQELDKYMADLDFFYDEFNEVAVSSLQLAHEVSKGQQQTLRQLLVAASNKLDGQVAIHSKLVRNRSSQVAAETEAVIAHQLASIQKLELEFGEQLDQNLTLRTEVERANEATQQKQMEVVQCQQDIQQLRAEIAALERTLAVTSAATDQERKNATNWKALCSQYKQELHNANEKCMQSLEETDSLRKQLSTLTAEKRRLTARLESLQERDDLIAQVSSPNGRSADEGGSSTPSAARRPSSLYSTTASFIPSSPFIAKTHSESPSTDPTNLTHSLESARVLLLEDRLRLANEELRVHRQSALHQSQVSLESSSTPSRFSTSLYFTPSPIKRLGHGSAR